MCIFCHCRLKSRPHWRRSRSRQKVAGDKKSTATNCRLRLRQQCGRAI